MFEPNVKLNRFEENYVKRYESEPAPKGRILFYGPSNFTRWAPRWNNPRLEDEILMKDGSPACLNRAFGGSCIEEQLYYYPRLVRPCAPRALVLSAYGNHASHGYTPADVFFLATRILEYARTDFPGIKLFFCDVPATLRASELRPGSVPAREDYNELVRYYCEKHEDTTFVQHWTWPGFFTEGGTGKPECVRPELFIDDHVHFNAEGYAVYRDFFYEYLKDLL